MRAFQSSNPVDRRLHKNEVPTPKAEGTKVLVKVLASGVCHSDVNILNPDAPLGSSVFTLGHESCGEVYDITPEGLAKFPHLTKGTVVAVYGPNSCQQPTCKHCASGRLVLCKNSLPLGLGSDGGYADYLLAEGHSLVKVPDALVDKPAIVAVTTDAVLTPYHALAASGIAKEVKPEFDYNVAVLGLGGLGSNILQILNYQLKEAKVRNNVKIYALDIKQPALDLAKTLNIADELLLVEGAQEALAGKGVSFDYVFDCCGAVATYMLAQQILAPGGKISLIGLYENELTHNSLLGLMKETITIQTYWGELNELVECLELVAKGVVVPKVTTRSLEEVNDVLQDFDDHKVVGRVVVIP